MIPDYSHPFHKQGNMSLCNFLITGSLFTYALDERSQIAFLNFFKLFHVIQQFRVESYRNHLLCHIFNKRIY